MYAYVCTCIRMLTCIYMYKGIRVVDHAEMVHFMIHLVRPAAVYL